MDGIYVGSNEDIEELAFEYEAGTDTVRRRINKVGEEFPGISARVSEYTVEKGGDKSYRLVWLNTHTVVAFYRVRTWVLTGHTIKVHDAKNEEKEL